MMHYMNKHLPGCAEKLRQGIALLNFVCKLYKHQHTHGRKFLHEHPWGATSWCSRCVQKGLALPGMEVAYMDQCMVGQKVIDRHGESLPAKKPTGWMTNSPRVYEALSLTCNKQHRHADLRARKASETASYRAEVVFGVLRALREELQCAGR